MASSTTLAHCGGDGHYDFGMDMNVKGDIMGVRSVPLTPNLDEIATPYCIIDGAGQGQGKVNRLYVDIHRAMKEIETLKAQNGTDVFHERTNDLSFYLAGTENDNGETFQIKTVIVVSEDETHVPSYAIDFLREHLRNEQDDYFIF